MTRILMLMPYQQYVRKAVAEGFRVYAIWDPSYESPAYLDAVAAHAEELILADFSDVAGLRRLVAETARRHDVAHVLHLGKEDTQWAVCDEAGSLGLAPNPPSAIRQINDKAAMRALLREHGLSPVRSAAVDSPAEVPRVLDAFDLPVVVKPTGLDGSRAVRLVRDRADLDEWAESLGAYGYTGQVLVEERLRGPEFSVETLTAAGTHHVLGVTAKRLGPPPGFVEAGHLHPAPLAEAEWASVTGLVTAFLDAAGYRFGPAHTEVILTAGGPRIVESQTRVGGDRIPLLIELATGFDVEAAVYRALRGEPVRPPAAGRMGCVEFFDLGPGLLESLDGLDEIEALPYVHALKVKFQPGDVLPPVVDSRTRHGYVVVDAGSPGQAAERCAAALGLLRAVVRPAEGDHQRPAGHERGGALR
ncbi:ATP-grasp domain-containing protein [Planotetraspora sp. A-T 1434]|uniref:ATP-grasp domain-containing protein n=1 Tax=Planotetraspora sp. A-T 1434 TaxID=2979219 RepID=UPI0021C1FC8B|nr:ATP-grasp domain-containing protein [Planotetraspora sp. A-T 1434]MCT9933582.1 ATP-grasp domain-containing protein [Planotetraspora sp. A-T 1434]